MFRPLLLLVLLLITASSFTVMTFNMYHFGAHVHDGLRKVADQIRHVDADIVALQEAGADDHLDQLCSLLGEDWSGALNVRGSIDGRGVITRHKIVGEYGGYSRGYNVRIQLRDSEQEISVWSVYLTWREYGPYKAQKGDATTMEQILKGEYDAGSYNSRVHNIKELLANAEFQKQISNADATPVIVAGDFNAPSDLDWVNATKHKHHGWAVEWPATKLMRTEGGMRDSFREVHPDPLKVPGYTWGIYERESSIIELKARIDFIFYRGPLRPIRSFPFSGTTPVLYPKKHSPKDAVVKVNEWPSDHYAFVTEFEPRSDEISSMATATTETTTMTTSTVNITTTNPSSTTAVGRTVTNAPGSNRGLSLTIGVLVLLLIRRFG